MRIHERIEQAIRPYKGQELGTYQIHKIVKETFPDINLNSVLPNDHAEATKHNCHCVTSGKQLFIRVKEGRYIVR